MIQNGKFSGNMENVDESCNTDDRWSIRVSMLFRSNEEWNRSNNSFGIDLVFVGVLNGLPLSPDSRSDNRHARFEVAVGPCTWIFDRRCPDDNIRFYLFTRKNKMDRQLVHVDDSWNKSNISRSNFNPNHPVKIIIHGYNSDMFLSPLIQMKDGQYEFVTLSEVWMTFGFVRQNIWIATTTICFTSIGVIWRQHHAIQVQHRTPDTQANASPN